MPLKSDDWPLFLRGEMKTHNFSSLYIRVLLIIKVCECAWWEDLQRQVAEAVDQAGAARSVAWGAVLGDARSAVADSGIDDEASEAQSAVSTLLQSASQAGADVSRCAQTSRGEMTEAAGRMGLLMFDCMSDSTEILRQAKAANRTMSEARRRAAQCGGSTLETYDCTAGVWLGAASALRGNVEGILGGLAAGPEPLAADLSAALGPCATSSYDAEKSNLGQDLDAFGACVRQAIEAAVSSRQ